MLRCQTHPVFVLIFLALCAALWPFQAWALPKESRVPGGVALVPLGRVLPDAPAPRAWLGEQPVLVAPDQGNWLAVVGLALDLPPGSHALRVEDAGNDAPKILNFDVRAQAYPEQHIKLKSSSKVNLSPADEARAVREIATIQKLKRHWSNVRVTQTDFILPASGRLSSRFGLRRFFNDQERAPHSGLDLAVPRGTPIHAAASGIVLAADDYFFNGQSVFIDHGNGLISLYCHLDQIDVQVGDEIRQGESLGLSGMTGRASGPHLHWGVILNGAMVNPELFVAGKK